MGLSSLLRTDTLPCPNPLPVLVREALRERQALLRRRLENEDDANAVTGGENPTADEVGDGLVVATEASGVASVSDNATGASEVGAVGGVVGISDGHDVHSPPQDRTDQADRSATLVSGAVLRATAAAAAASAAATVVSDDSCSDDSMSAAGYDDAASDYDDEDDDDRITLTVYRRVPTRAKGHVWTALTNYPTVVANVVVSTGAWYYEIKFLSNPMSVQVGWVTGSFHGVSPRFMGVGDDRYSWAFDAGRKILWHDGRSGNTRAYPKWKEGDVVGVTVDCEARSMSYTLNGEAHGPSFHGIDPHGGLLPAVSLKRKVGVEFRFHQSEMEYFPGDRHGRAVGEPSTSALSTPPGSARGGGGGVGTSFGSTGSTGSVVAAGLAEVPPTERSASLPTVAHLVANNDGDGDAEDAEEELRALAACAPLGLAPWRVRKGAYAELLTRDLGASLDAGAGAIATAPDLVAPIVPGPSSLAAGASSEPPLPIVGSRLTTDSSDLTDFFQTTPGGDLTLRAGCFGDTLLHFAAAYGLIGLVERVLDFGAPVDLRNGFAATPLFCVCLRGHFNIILHDIFRGIDSEERYLRVVETLLARGADINARDKQDTTALMASARGGHVAVAALLLEHGADINCTNNKGYTPLRAAAFYGYYELTAFLLDQGADHGMTDCDGSQPLRLAAANGHARVVDLLAHRGADVDALDKQRSSAIRVAACLGHRKTVAVLMRHRADIHQRNRKEYSPLRSAAFDGHLDIVKILLDAGAAIEVRDFKGATPLRVAAYNGHCDVVAYLLSQGAELEAVDNMGRTALFIACQRSKLDVAAFLVQRGANVLTPAKDNRTPLVCARQQSSVLVPLMLSTICNIDATTSHYDPADDDVGKARALQLARLETKAVFLVLHAVGELFATLNFVSGSGLAMAAPGRQAAALASFVHVFFALPIELRHKVVGYAVDDAVRSAVLPAVQQTAPTANVGDGDVAAVARNELEQHQRARGLASMVGLLHCYPEPVQSVILEAVSRHATDKSYSFPKETVDAYTDLIVFAEAPGGGTGGDGCAARPTYNEQVLVATVGLALGGFDAEPTASDTRLRTALRVCCARLCSESEGRFRPLLTASERNLITATARATRAAALEWDAELGSMLDAIADTRARDTALEAMFGSAYAGILDDDAPSHVPIEDLPPVANGPIVWWVSGARL